MKNSNKILLTVKQLKKLVKEAREYRSSRELMELISKGLDEVGIEHEMQVDGKILIADPEFGYWDLLLK